MIKYVPVGTGVLDGPKAKGKANIWLNKNMLWYNLEQKIEFALFKPNCYSCNCVKNT